MYISGYLLWDDAGVVYFLNVNDILRRKGIASYLYELACEKAGSQLSPSEDVSAEGMAFIEGLKVKGKYQ